MQQVPLPIYLYLCSPFYKGKVVTYMHQDVNHANNIMTRHGNPKILNEVRPHAVICTFLLALLLHENRRV
jgi:hypothetical protein